MLGMAPIETDVLPKAEQGGGRDPKKLPFANGENVEIRDTITLANLRDGPLVLVTAAGFFKILS